MFRQLHLKLTYKDFCSFFSADSDASASHNSGVPGQHQFAEALGVDSGVPGQHQFAEASGVNSGVPGQHQFAEASGVESDDPSSGRSANRGMNMSNV